MRTGEKKSYTLAAFIVLVTVVPFWFGVFWLTGILDSCISVWSSIIAFDYRDFFSQPIENDAPYILLIGGSIWFLLHRLNRRQTSVPITVLNLRRDPAELRPLE